MHAYSMLAAWEEAWAHETGPGRERFGSRTQAGGVSWNAEPPPTNLFCPHTHRAHRLDSSHREHICNAARWAASSPSGQFWWQASQRMQPTSCTTTQTPSPSFVSRGCCGCGRIHGSRPSRGGAESCMAHALQAAGSSHHAGPFRHPQATLPYHSLAFLHSYDIAFRHMLSPSDNREQRLLEFVLRTAPAGNATAVLAVGTCLYTQCLLCMTDLS